MPLDLATTAPATSPAKALGWRQRRRERLRLRPQDRRAAELAGLHLIRAIAADAQRIVAAGWVQNHWFTYRDTAGHERAISAHNAHQLGDHPVTRACLVGAIVHAGGGLSAVSTQPVQRALDLTWHTLFLDGRQPVRWCPAPAVRTIHLRELTRWNDHPARTAGDVSMLLQGVERAASAEIQRVHA